MNITKLSYTLILLVFLGGCTTPEDYKDGKYNKEQEVESFTLSNTYKVQKIAQYNGSNEHAKNIILLIGDGMGSSHVFAGITANKGETYFQQFKNMGYSKTASANNYTTDSAAGGTAISTGESTNNGAVGVDVNNKPLKTILEIAEEYGKATGMVATSSITHATPASFIAHQPKRNMYQEIALDFMDTDIDVFIGGGENNFNKRDDGLNLIDSLKSKGYAVLYNQDDIERFEGDKLAGFIAKKHPKGILERGDYLVPSSKKAIQILSKNEKGFFLMIEGSMIDWAAHGNNMGELINEIADFDKAIGEALKFAEADGNTLVIVTADHETGGFAVKNGNDKTGEVKGVFSSSGHTATMVPVFAYGPGADKFRGIYKNTNLFDKMLESYDIGKE